MAKKSEDIEPADEIVKRSGHNLHSEVIELLKEKDFEVEISPYYVDAYSDKPREVDIVARKKFPKLEGSRNTIELVVSIDCKYINQNTVFWEFPTVPSDDGIKTTETNASEFINNVGRPAFKYLSLEKASRLSQTGKRIESDPVGDPIYKATSQAINGLIFARNQSPDPSILFPLVVVDGPGKLYLASDTKNEVIDLIMEVDYSFYPNRDTAVKPRREQFFVDIARLNRTLPIVDRMEKEAQYFKKFHGVIEARTISAQWQTNRPWRNDAI